VKERLNNIKQLRKIKLLEDGDAIRCQGEAEKQEFDSFPLRVSVWNMDKGAGKNFVECYQFLSSISDLLITQEALLSSKNQAVFFRRPELEIVHASYYKRKDGLRDGVMTASRVEAIKELTYAIPSKRPEPVLRTPKVALVTHYQLEGCPQALMVVNIHTTLLRGRLKAQEEIENVVENIYSYRGPIILAGDFNVFSPGYLQPIEEALESINLKRVVFPRDPRPWRSYLDQVFLRGFDPKNVGLYITRASSDHFPLILGLCPKKG